MNKVFKFLAVLSLIFVFAALPTVAVAAAPAMQEQVPAELPSLWDIAETMKNLGGITLLLTAFLNALKQFGKLHDGDAPKYTLIFQTLALVGAVALQLFGKADLIPVIDENAGLLANAVNSVLLLIFQLYVARVGHENVLAGLPMIGKSFSGRHAGEFGMTELVMESDAKSPASINVNDLSERG